MKPPEFAERQYEAAIYIELSRGTTSPFIPTQNVELHLGIDAAADPGRLNAIWRILDVQIPRRTRLSPALWPLLPPRFNHIFPSGRFYSLFLQVKVADYQDGKRCKYRDKFGGPYFQVKITAHQQETLKDLEGRVRGRALVRYAAPAFWSRSDFDKHDQARQILHNSSFVAPSTVKKHRRWMYDAQSSRQVLNPDPEEIRPELWAALATSIQTRALDETLFEHVSGLAASIRGEALTLFFEDATWIRRLSQYGEFDNDAQALLYNLSVVARYAEMANVWWLLLVIPDSSTRALLSHLENHPWYPWHYPL